MDKVVKIREINPHIVCSLCAGYFIDATTITECLHTFCRRCIIKYLQLSKYCPTCNMKVHETQPLLNVRLDRTMQDIVYKVVPNLFEDEEVREHEFYEERGMPVPKKDIESEECESDEESHSSLVNDVTEYMNNYRDDELISIYFKPYDGPLENLYKHVISRQYLRCSHRVLILHLEKLFKKKINLMEKQELQFFCENKLVNSASSLKQLYVVNWGLKDLPMCLQYRVYSTPNVIIQKEISTSFYSPLTQDTIVQNDISTDHSPLTQDTIIQMDISTSVHSPLTQDSIIQKDISTSVHSPLAQDTIVQNDISTVYFPLTQDSIIQKDNSTSVHSPLTQDTWL
ncbi:polycomb group RING finger protein 1-like isoform X1 [Xenia sp. Carnegie-2017]|uniref:polycomb group RING finger protein 1-like isoform X1 n=1 Tax=Xenia sp. Carnegie-2017 TaxID=2897299 RepID=UPI001F0398B6|nr:polycomb group RING finger protein 1-like isoform X1 [Xenia sp. Carnegie-2017]XP_046850716.1 polycomb group RING finger protein 1-like isoform X1 [Xenia sp. Carnegie-2017]